MYTDDKDRILNNIKIDKATGCWQWRLARGAQGYGVAKVRGKQWRAHRLSYHLLNNPASETEIPSGMCVLHRCDNTSCVNPTHMFLGTLADNNADRAKKGRSHRPIGEMHNMAKLSETDVLEIRELCSRAVLTHSEIANIYGVTRPHVSSIKAGSKWPHLLPIKDGRDE